MSDIRIAKEWLRHSQNDLIVARHSYEDLYPKQTEIACYLCWQCAETALKGYLVFKDINPPRSHDLIALSEQCIIIDTAFSSLREHCKTLNLFGAQIRYPNELAIDEAIAGAAIEKARQVYSFCAAKIDAPSSAEYERKGREVIGNARYFYTRKKNKHYEFREE
jgi:HEPN domain-containing protein